METMTDLYAIMPVSDRAAADEWYALFFGRSADVVMTDESLWRIGASAWVVVDDRRDHPGRGEVTIAIEGLDTVLARLGERGVAHEPVETYGNGVRHVTIADPDGNRLSLAEPPAA